MVTPALPLTVPLELRGPAELAGPIDDGALQKPPLSQVFKQGGKSLVDARRLLFHRFDAGGVHVPAVIHDGDEGNPVFHQPACEQAGLAERIAAVTIAELVVLL